MNAQHNRNSKAIKRNAKCIVYLSLLSVCNTGNAEKVSNETLLNQYKKLLAEQQKEFQAQREIIASQGKELEQLKSRLDALTTQKAESKSPPGQPTSRPVVTAAADRTEPSAKPNPLPNKPVGQAPPSANEKPRPPEIARLTDEVGGVLTRKGKIVLEPSVEYGYADSNRVFLDAFTFLPAIAVGLIDIREIKRHTLMGSLAARYGVTDRLELELKAPYIYRSDTQRSRPVSISTSQDVIFNATGDGIGDLEGTARYQLNNGTNGWPIFVGNMSATVPTGKSPFDVAFVPSTAGATFPAELATGVGYYSFQPSVTALYPSDPGVFFANLSYSFNAETSENVGNYDPGDTIGLSFGMGFGLNERSSFSLGYQHRHVFSSALNGETIVGSELDIGQLLIGYSYRYSPQTTFNTSLSIGTTNDAQAVRLNFRMPLTFDFLSTHL